VLRQANEALPEDQRVKVLRHIAIEDLDNLGMKHYHSKGLELLKEAIAIDEGFFPEHLARLYVVNAPAVFRVIWAVVKPWMDPRTLAKIQILGSNYTEALLQDIPSEELPAALGGLSAETLPTNSGEYSDKLPSGLSLNPRSVTVGRRDELVVDFQVSATPATLTVEFSTRDNNIGFGLRDNNNNNFIAPMQRYDAHREPVTFTQTLTTTGSYSVIFDNTFSMFSSKSLTYHIKLVEPAPTN
jgi:hypothetical protein